MLFSMHIAEFHLLFVSSMFRLKIKLLSLIEQKQRTKNERRFGRHEIISSSLCRAMVEARLVVPPSSEVSDGLSLLSDVSSPSGC